MAEQKGENKFFVFHIYALIKVVLTFSAGGLDTGAGVGSFERGNTTLNTGG